MTNIVVLSVLMCFNCSSAWSHLDYWSGVWVNVDFISIAPYTQSVKGRTSEPLYWTDHSIFERQNTGSLLLYIWTSSSGRRAPIWHLSKKNELRGDRMRQAVGVFSKGYVCCLQPRDFKSKLAAVSSQLKKEVQQPKSVQRETQVWLLPFELRTRWTVM